MNSEFRFHPGALFSNAQIVRELVESQGMKPVAVLKSHFRTPTNIELCSRAGFDTMTFSMPPTNDRLPLQAMSLYPAASRWRWPKDTIFTELDIPAIGHLLKRASPSDPRLDLMIPILTGDAREGLRSRELGSFLEALHTNFGGRVRVRGLQVCYGCVDERPPSREELAEVITLAARISQAGTPAVLSVGGSVMLPVLDGIPRRDDVQIEVRVGEAIVAGTIPGRGTLFGLRPTASLLCDVIQRDLSGNRPALLIHHGRFSITGAGARLAIEGARIAGRWSEHSRVEFIEGTDVSKIDKVELLLAYGDINQCLGQRRQSRKQATVQEPYGSRPQSVAAVPFH